MELTELIKSMTNIKIWQMISIKILQIIDFFYNFKYLYLYESKESIKNIKNN